MRSELGKPDEASTDRYRKVVADHAALDRLLVDLFLESHGEPPGEIVLDLDATDDPIHGHQEGRFFHGYYDHPCFLPLFILCCRLRSADRSAADGSVDELSRIVARGDSDFGKDGIMVWCEAHDVDHVSGCGQNVRLIARELERSRRAVPGVGQSLQAVSDPLVMVPGAPCGGQGRVAAGTARQERPLRGDEHLEEDAARPERHGEQDQQLWLFSDRASAHIMRANQLRMYFSAFAAPPVPAGASTRSAPDCSSLPAGSTGRCAGSASVWPRPMCSPAPSSTCVPRPRRHPGSSGSIPSQTDASVSHRRRERCAWRTPEHQESGFDPVNLRGSAEKRPETRHNPAGSSLKLFLDCRSGPKSGYHSPW